MTVQSLVIVLVILKFVLLVGIAIVSVSQDEPEKVLMIMSVGFSIFVALFGAIICLLRSMGGDDDDRYDKRTVIKKRHHDILERRVYARIVPPLMVG
mmetsp:Transcript_7794/g.22187  ORF Transcript_7794/g.22187 Transcript_7794/m.22187 type:complete len:97 (+) Transcript_7794:63-353(+)